ncbi:exo-beta-N-acetylmuramidase NamZ domain-containing protein [Geothrix oryzisoli]|uniref:exo-beta-N-acetylmuramidase NamZ domain-containing protein n=1 Tax=Geothrix oryzisoli TaxID=2922721 RepID=UPI001FAD780F|nr:exo-beta-N-acetylmuramidase NamZ domain-containing protein [Geothrix oryzisoli]
MRLAALLLSALVLQAGAFNDQGIADIRAALARAIEDKVTPGAVYWCGHGSEDRHWAQGHRAVVPAAEPMTEDTIFDVASLTKVVATLPSVMLLVERGKVDVDAPVRTYLPEFHHPEITVKHLLTHTSGLPPGLPKDEVHPDWHGYEEGIRRACACAPDLPPGLVVRYSDLNFILLGEIVHRVSGHRLDAFAEREVFSPLGMRSTRFRPEAGRVDRIAPTERDQDGTMLRGVVHDPTARRMGGVAGHAGLFTTAADLAKYARFMLHGGPVLQRKTLQAMQRVQTPATVYDRRGLGWDIDSAYSRPRGSLFELGSFGHTGFTGTAIWMDPATDSFFILLTTRLHPDGKGDAKPLYSEIGTLTAKAIGLTARKDSGCFARAPQEVPTVLNGIDVLKRQKFAALQGLRVGLVTNRTGIDNERNATIDLLREAPGVRLVRLFSPEHGIRGELDQEGIPDALDTRTGLPVISLYKGSQRAPSSEDLADLDALVFDVQDIGCRFYTYIATLKGCLEAAAKSGKAFILLDRVNPIGGALVEGPALPSDLSFTACHPIALRHGMTVGELARMFNAELSLHARLRVIELQGWRRRQWFDATALPWESPSPNMRTLNAAALYPGIGLLERAISVGRGTGTPFEVVGAPYINDRVLASELTKLGLPGVRFIPERFTPTTSRFKGEACGGVRLVLVDREALRPVELGLAIALTLHRLYGEAFDLQRFDDLLKDDATLGLIRSGKGWKEIVASWEPSRTGFLKRRQPFLLYEP